MQCRPSCSDQPARFHIVILHALIRGLLFLFSFFFCEHASRPPRYSYGYGCFLKTTARISDRFSITNHLQANHPTFLLHYRMNQPTNQIPQSVFRSHCRTHCFSGSILCIDAVASRVSGETNFRTRTDYIWPYHSTSINHPRDRLVWFGEGIPGRAPPSGFCFR